MKSFPNRFPLPFLFLAILALLAALWAGLMRLEWQIFQVVFFWQAILILTITGERLELSRALLGRR